MTFPFDPKMAIVALIFIIFDIITGVLSALITGTFKSSTMRKGGLRKLFLCMVIIFGILLDYAQTMVSLGISVPATSLIGGYITLMEIMSIIENINKAYPNALPKKLIQMLNTEALNNGVETNETKESDTE